jgi:hypothetical protein
MSSLFDFPGGLLSFFLCAILIPLRAAGDSQSKTKGQHESFHIFLNIDACDAALLQGDEAGQASTNTGQEACATPTAHHLRLAGVPHGTKRGASCVS